MADNVTASGHPKDRTSDQGSIGRDKSAHAVTRWHVTRCRAICDETSRRAGCRNSARPVRKAGIPVSGRRRRKPGMPAATRGLAATALAEHRQMSFREPVSFRYRTGLRHVKTEIGKWRAETGTAKPRVGTRNPENPSLETGRLWPNPRK